MGELFELFERMNAASESIKKSEAQTARLECKVGQLVIEKEVLEKSACQPPFPRPPVRPNGSFRGLPQKANS